MPATGEVILPLQQGPTPVEIGMSAFAAGAAKVRRWRIPLKKWAGVAEPWRFGSATSGGFRPSCRSWRGHWNQFREFAEVLGGCCEMELATRPIRTAQSQAIELQDALEVGEQHFRMVGGAGRTAQAYRGGIDLDLPLERLLQTSPAILRPATTAVKSRSVSRTLEATSRVLAAVRDLIGPDITFMVDANYGLDVPQAIAMARALMTFDIFGSRSRSSPMTSSATASLPRQRGSRSQWAKTFT